MNWYNATISSNLVVDCYGTNIVVQLNDENKKPDWVNVPAQFSEFHIQRDKKNLVLVIGESWTYGESLPGVATGIQQYNLESQLLNCFGPKISLMMDCDYYQYAVPGNCNAYMFQELERILDHLSTNFNYDKIYLYMQITEPGRELAIEYKLRNTMFGDIYDFPNGITFDDWLTRYDEIFLNNLDSMMQQYPSVNTLVWKNFCCFQNKKQYTSFKILNESWIKFSANFLGKELKMIKFQSVGWFDDFSTRYKNKIVFQLDEINTELDKIEQSNAFIRSNDLHSNHPNVTAHKLWALNLYNNTPNV